MSDTTWLMGWSARTWTFGLVFGPEVDELHVGPLTVSRVRGQYQ